MAGKLTLFKSGNSGSFPSPSSQRPATTPPPLLRLSIFSLKITTVACQRVTASAYREDMWEWHSDDILQRKGLESLTYTERETLKTTIIYSELRNEESYWWWTWFYFLMMLMFPFFQCEEVNRIFETVQNIWNSGRVYSVHIYSRATFLSYTLATVLVLFVTHDYCTCPLLSIQTVIPHFSGYLSSRHPPSTETPHWQSNVPYYSPH